MATQCPSCRAAMTVDVSRIPAGSAARVTCPTCQHVFPVQGPAPAATVTPAAGAASSPSASGSPQDVAWLRRELEGVREQMEHDVTEACLARVLGALGVRAPDADVASYDEEGRTALVCLADVAMAATVASVLKDLGYAAQAAPDLRTAWKLLDVPWRVVVLGDAMPDDPQSGTRLLDRLSRLPGPQRRKTFVTYLSEEIRTMDGGVAFVLGANLTVHVGDVGRIKDLLRAGIAERDKLYKPFLEARSAVRG